jgi:hypothetical protein
MTVEKGAYAPKELRNPADVLEILLNEARTHVDIELYQQRIADHFEAVDFAGLDHEDVSRAAFEGFAIDGPHPTAFADELNFVIGVPMWARTRAGFSPIKKYRNTGVSLIGSDEFEGTPNKRQTFLADVVHRR